MVAHRLSTIVKAHRIFVLENGEIAEQGTHAEMIARPGPYADLWRVQTGLAAV
jgi:ABC-type transport system involved in Fe-S cluster assembly fused permease/ATPase subunit